VRAAVAAAPDVATGHEILGLALELRGAPVGEARTAYGRALELDEANAYALAGMGRLAAGEDPAAALAYFDRALAADAKAEGAAVDSAQALAALDRGAEAEGRLLEVLEGDPTDLDAAAALVELRLGRGDSAERTLELANRGVRFGGGAEALDRLSRVHAARGETESASETAARAEKLRDGSGDEG
jgi:Tfp pilus assembly protein PilF